jgi:hypothetical protein
MKAAPDAVADLGSIVPGHDSARREGQTSLDENTEVEMSVSVLYMSMSLDGYIAGPNDEPGNPGGDGFDRLHKWYGTSPDRPGRSDNCGTNGTHRVRCWRVGVP